MSFIGRVVAIIFSRHTLALIGITALGLALWFGGPYLGFGESHPLEPVGIRLLVIVILLSFLVFWLLHWPLSMVIMVTLCLLLWHLSPQMAFGGARPLEPEWARILLIGVIVFFYSLYLLYRLWQVLRANEDLLQKILHPNFGRPESIAKEQIREVEGIFKAALKKLKSLRTGLGAAQSFFQRTRYIYDLPWYILIGAPGSGKTTALLNSGLKFPLADQEDGLAGSGGTRNCVWWFTNEAVLIDTAGRYTTHEGNKEKEVDQAEWHGFLKLLREHRPQSPINGALLIISAEDITGKTTEESTLYGACLRGRIEDIRSNLGINFPVYVLVTKMDFVKGFKEYFHHLTPEGRSQVWGFTLPMSKILSALDVKKQCITEMDLLVKRLAKGLPQRLHDELDITRTRALYCLPSEMNALSKPLLNLLEHIFPESRYGDSMPNMLRGVYFISAMQTAAVVNTNNPTIFQRFFNFSKDGLTAYSGAQAEHSESLLGNKSYFIRNLIQKVIFPEANMVRPNLRWEARFRLTRFAGHMLTMLVSATICYALWNSHEANTGMLSAVEKEVGTIGEKLSVIEAEKREDLIAQTLFEACNLGASSGLDLTSPPLAWRLGLYSGDPVVVDGAYLCQQLQNKMLLPRLAARLEEALEEMTTARLDKKNKLVPQAAASNIQMYDALRIYLRLLNKDRYDAEDILSWFAEDMRINGRKNFFARHSLLFNELERCLTRPDGVLLPSAKERLIVNIRNLLDQSPVKERIYERAKAHMAKDSPDDFSISKIIGPSASRIFYRKSKEPLEKGIPGLFTKAGYHDLFNAQLTKFTNSALDEDAWVMGEQGRGKRALAIDPGRDIRQLYLQEYARRWEEFLADIHPVTGNSLTAIVSSIQAAAAPASSVHTLARAISLETTLTTPSDPSLLDKIPGAAAKVNSAAKASASFRPESLREREIVDVRFAALREAVYGSGDPKSITKEQQEGGSKVDAMLGSLREFAAYLKEAQIAREANTPTAPSELAVSMQAEAERLPQFLKNIMRDFLDEGLLKAAEARGDTLGIITGNSVGEICRSSIAGYYPFNIKGQDVDPARFARFFGPGGTMDSFFQKNLAQYVDTSISPWRYKQVMPGAPDLKPFERAAAIREIFFSEEGGKAGIKLTLTPEDVDNRINRLSVMVDGKEWRYEHGPVVPLIVSIPGGSPGGMEISISPKPQGTSTFRASGPFAVMRVISMGKTEATGTGGRFYVNYDWAERSVIFEVSGPEQNPLFSDLFTSFTCPETSRDFGARMLR